MRKRVPTEEQWKIGGEVEQDQVMDSLEVWQNIQLG